MLHDSHYVSRFLTKPWEDEQRFLTYVDLETQEVRRQSSKSLFVKPEGLDTEMESLFGKYVETHVGNLRKRWLDTGVRPLPRNWAELRALYLLLALQAPRYIQLCRRPEGVDRLQLLREDQATIDIVARGLHDQYNLVTFVVTEGRLFMPETGVFGFYVHDRGCATGCTLATGIPLHPQILLAMVSKSVTEDVLAWEAKHHRHMIALSVGSSASLQRVIIPREILLGEGESDTVRYVNETIARNQMLLRQFEERRALAVRMLEAMGMKLSERKVGDPVQFQWTEETLVLT